MTFFDDMGDENVETMSDEHDYSEDDLDVMNAFEELKNKAMTVKLSEEMHKLLDKKDRRA